MRPAGYAAITLVAFLAGVANAQTPANDASQSAVLVPNPVVATARAALSATAAPLPDDVTAAASRSVTYRV
ncbi:hypothetical protein, partial [Phenylobacterium sp.]|uniref:hypothetical protein n=1 Tax=Phenylobacterium sp. TaxID=1871053 RepID=UPI0037C8C492